MTLKTRIAKYLHYNCTSEEAKHIINELLPKLDIARKALIECRFHAADIKRYNPEVQRVVNEALKLTDIEQEQPE